MFTTTFAVQILAAVQILTTAVILEPNKNFMSQLCFKIVPYTIVIVLVLSAFKII